MADAHTVARPYAQAVFELAQGSGYLELWSGALSAAADLAANEEVAAIIGDPRRSDAEQVSFLADLLERLGQAQTFGDDGAGRNFLHLLVENDRVSVLPEISEHFETLKAETENTVDVTVTAASEMSETELDNIRKALADKLGRRINISTAIDRDLIGGAVIRAGDFVIDGSVRSRLAKLATALTT